jgi:hypothetical protein
MNQFQMPGRAVSIGRRNTQAEAHVTLGKKVKSLARVRSAKTLPWLGLAEDSQTDRFSQGSVVELRY